MCDFMIGNQLGKVFLANRTEAGALLRFLGEKRKGRNVKEARPSLTKGSGNRRDGEIMKGKWAGEGFVKMNRGIDLFSELP